MIQEYEVILSKNFKADLESISKYISDILLSPESADKIVNDILDVAESLSFMPERYAVVKQPCPSKSMKRRVICGNYAVYYTIDKKKEKVYVVQVIRKGRDVKRLMRS